ncbi:MAG: rhodanese-like domain-containing protein [Bacteroidales bacterium]|jgi:rhodanese-related sulfurtransferase|nr:rhodanese-like domain-containing protein [Bacteroidales bacterium]
MKPRTILAAAVIPLGLIIAAVPQNTTKPYKLTADQLLAEVNSRTQFISPDVVADMLVSKDPSIRLIDVRAQDEFEKYSLPGAVNIPLSDILSDEWSVILDQDVKMNVFYSNGTVTANEAWLITRQLGYQNNFVLEGGLNYWFENILNPQPPASTSPNEEFAKYDFRKSASMALGGGGITPLEGSSAPPPALPGIVPKTAKKKVSGGC